MGVERELKIFGLYQIAKKQDRLMEYFVVDKTVRCVGDLLGINKV